MLVKYTFLPGTVHHRDLALRLDMCYDLLGPTWPSIFLYCGGSIICRNVNFIQLASVAVDNSMTFDKVLFALSIQYDEI